MTRPALAITFAGLSDVGRTRSRNEDAFGIDELAGLGLVCDGMGGHAGGDIASRTAAEALLRFLTEFQPSAGGPAGFAGGEAPMTQAVTGGPEMENALTVVRSGMQIANSRLVELNQQRGFADGRGMGTTVVGLWRIGQSDKIVGFHCGDSRLYRHRAGALVQLTRDHSLYQLWLDNGSRGPAPNRNIIVRALGTSQQAEPDVGVHTLQLGDIYLLCSDGLTGMVSDEVITRILDGLHDRDLEEGCKHLVLLANENGGVDNITVVLGRVRLD